jgi:phytoene/squalene synthetase
MMTLYDSTVAECSKLITTRYSTSFTLGIKTLAPKYREAVYNIYGFVRLADEIVDTFHTFDKETLMKRFRQDTVNAINEGISINPVLHAYQNVANQYKFEWELTDAFLRSMEMDLYKTSYNSEGYNEYIYGSAEVVGLMCLRVFCQGNEEEYQRLKPFGRKLGAAFQKVNFLRDLKADFDERGRVYFPGCDFTHFNETTKKAIEADIAADFAEAYKGIMMLPKGAKEGVYLAYSYYMRLFNKIKSTPSEVVAVTRIRVPDTEKMAILAFTWFKGLINAY